MSTHVNTYVLGETFSIYKNTSQECTVYPYIMTYKPRVVTIAHGGTAYDHSDGVTYILDVNNGFNMVDVLSISLLNPNQMRANGIMVDDIPIHLSLNASSTHSIFIPDMNLRIPLRLDGVISYLTTRKPSEEEINNCVHITLMALTE